MPKVLALVLGLFAIETPEQRRMDKKIEQSGTDKSAKNNGGYQVATLGLASRLGEMRPLGQLPARFVLPLPIGRCALVVDDVPICGIAFERSLSAINEIAERA